jgi:acetyl esterase/lipase
MRSIWKIALGCILLSSNGLALAAEPMTLKDYMDQSGPEPSARIAYGGAPSQYVEVFLPAGPGPFPVVVNVHGGCWVTKYEGIRQTRTIAAALAAEGIAVWNVEYRRIDEEGGGFPGTFQDVVKAFDLLANRAATYHIDVNRLVAMGHSAGGQLVQWMASRAMIPATSPLHADSPSPIRQVIALGSWNDLRNRVAIFPTSCGVDISKLVGTASKTRPDVFADTSPTDLLPNHSHTVLINGDRDQPQVAVAFADLARKAGDDVDLMILPHASHFDEAAAASYSWPLILSVIKKSLGP